MQHRCVYRQRSLQRRVFSGTTVSQQSKHLLAKPDYRQRTTAPTQVLSARAVAAARGLTIHAH